MWADVEIRNFFLAFVYYLQRQYNISIFFYYL